MLESGRRFRLDLVQSIVPSWPAWAGRLAWAAFTVAVAAVAAAMLRRLVRRWAGKAAERTGDLLRLRRQETAAALLANILRYGVFLVAAFAIIGIFVRDSLTALGGASLLVLVVGFSAQRFLTDVVAGFFLLFEGQYGVGDFVTLEPSKLSGIVDDLGLRTTTLRALNGDRYFVPNGEITAVHRSARGFRPYHVELLTHEPEQAEQAIAGIGSKPGEARFLRPPRIVDRHDLGDGIWLVRVGAEVPVTLEWLAERLLVDVIKGKAAGALVAEPIAYTLDRTTLERYERRVVLGDRVSASGQEGTESAW